MHIGLIRDRTIWIAVATLFGMYGVGLPVGLFVASAQGTHVNWTAGPEIGSYAALVITFIIVTGAIVWPIKTSVESAPLQPAVTPPLSSRPEMGYEIGGGTHIAPLRPDEITSVSAFNPKGELLDFMRAEWLPTSSIPVRTDSKSQSVDHPNEPTSAYTATWRHTTEGMEAVGAMNCLRKRLIHPSDGMRRPEMQPPTVSFGLQVACDPLGAEPSASQLRAAFLGFLDRPPVRSFVSLLTVISNDASWSNYDGNGRLMLGAIFGDASDEQVVPIASALVNLDDNQLSSYQHPRCAELVLVVEPSDAAGAPAPSATFKDWHERLVTALDIPDAFVTFLSDEVGVETHANPPVQVGIRLQARPNVGVLIDVGSSTHLPGSAVTSDFPSYLIAEPGGQRAAQAAVDVLRTWCDHALHLDGYEGELTGLR